MKARHIVGAAVAAALLIAAGLYLYGGSQTLFGQCGFRAKAKRIPG